MLLEPAVRWQGVKRGPPTSEAAGRIRSAERWAPRWEAPDGSRQSEAEWAAVRHPSGGVLSPWAETDQVGVFVRRRACRFKHPDRRRIIRSSWFAVARQGWDPHSGEAAIG